MCCHHAFHGNKSSRQGKNGTDTIYVKAGLCTSLTEPQGTVWPARPQAQSPTYWAAKTTKVNVFYASHSYRQLSRHQPCLPTNIAGKMTPGRCPQNPGSVTLARDQGLCISMQHPTQPCADGAHTGNRWSAHRAYRTGSYGRHTCRAFRPNTQEEAFAVHVVTEHFPVVLIG